ncbi:MAG: CHASE2 domain-containing protein [Desulfotalea sp.]
MFNSNTPNVSSDIIILDIDEESIKEIGQWPWPRYKIASLLPMINKDKPIAIAFDILFPDHDLTSLKTIKKNFRDDYGFNLKTTGIPRTLENSDKYFGDRLRVSSSVGSVAYSRLLEDSSLQTKIINSSNSFYIDGNISLIRRTNNSLLTTNLEYLNNSFSILSFNNISLNGHSKVSSLPSYIQSGSKIYPNIALAINHLVNEGNKTTIASDWLGNYIQYKNGKVRLTEKGEITINFAKNTSFRRYSLSKFLKSDFPDGFFTSKIIFIGSSAKSIANHIPTPVGLLSSTVIHATMTENILTGQTIATPKHSKIFSIIILIILCLLLSLISRLLSPAMTALTYVFLTIALVSSNMMIFKIWNIHFPLEIILVLSFIYLIGLCIDRCIRSGKSLRYFKTKSKEQQLILETMVAVAESRESETGLHIQRTSFYVKCMAEQLYANKHPLIKDKNYIEQLSNSAPLHDIGKLTIPDSILLKNGPLDNDEYEEIKTHSLKGANLINMTAQHLKHENTYLNIAAEMALTHHEKWDGSGYPYGLKGEDIPISGRIMAVADVYDALISKRIYKDAYPHHKAKRIIVGGKGAHFDPTLVDIFLELEDEFQQTKQPSYSKLDKLKNILKRKFIKKPSVYLKPVNRGLINSEKDL